MSAVSRSRCRCRALGVSRSWFYKWEDGDRSPRRARRERLKAEVARLFAVHKGKRGPPMITADLQEAGWRVSKNTVAALMAEMGLVARPKKRRKGSTRPGKGRWRAPDLVKREFPAAGINQKWYGDGRQGIRAGPGLPRPGRGASGIHRAPHQASARNEVNWRSIVRRSTENYTNPLTVGVHGSRGLPQ